jgi:hypothetical protein
MSAGAGSNRLMAPEPWVGRDDLRAHLGRSDWWIELRLREGMPSKPYGRPRQFKLSEVEAWLKGRPETATDDERGR